MLANCTNVNNTKCEEVEPTTAGIGDEPIPANDSLTDNKYVELRRPFTLLIIRQQ